MNGPQLHVTPAEVLASTLVEEVCIAGRRFVIRRPADVDALLDHPETHAAYSRDQYMPYWCSLWPSARLLATEVLQGARPALGHVLELGCGLGLPGLAALACGHEVTFSDYDAAAVRFACENARLNGFEAHRGIVMDWRHPQGEAHPWVLGADLLYEDRLVVPLADALEALLEQAGEAWIADQGRPPAETWSSEMVRRGWVVQARRRPWEGFRGCVYRVSRSASRPRERG